MNDCISNEEPIIINRNADDSVVLLPLKKYKDLDETVFLNSNSEYGVHLATIFSKMKLKSKKILGPESFKSRAK